MNAARGVTLGLLVLAAVSGAALALQRQAADVLRQEATLLRDERQRLARVQTENLRLKAAQPATAEWERLRADHAAVVRLRAEIERLKARAAAAPPR